MPTTVDEEPIRRQLERVANLEFGPAKTLMILRHALVSREVKAAEQVYASLRSVMWVLLVTRSWNDMRDWYDVLRQISAFMLGKSINETVVSEKIRVLADMALESARFGNVHGDGSYTHEIPVLAFVQNNGGEASYEQIATGLNYQESILMRMLTVMYSRGSIRRSGYGRRTIFTLP